MTAALDHETVTRVARPEELFAAHGADAMLATLSEDERQRAGRLVFDEDRRAYVAAHHLLRATLAPILGRDPAAIEMVPGHGGRPELPPHGHGGVSFNLSHTRGLVACVVSSASVVGVDVEVVRDLPDVMSLARTTLCADEVRELERIAPSERSRAFLRRWTVKEAYAKATSHGLGLPLSSIAVRAADTSCPVVLDAATRTPRRGVRVVVGCHGTSHLIAIAYLSKEHTVKCGVQSHHEPGTVGR